jgi:hypothetical protein
MVRKKVLDFDVELENGKRTFQNLAGAEKISQNVRTSVWRGDGGVKSSFWDF